MTDLEKILKEIKDKNLWWHAWYYDGMIYITTPKEKV